MSAYSFVWVVGRSVVVEPATPRRSSTGGVEDEQSDDDVDVRGRDAAHTYPAGVTSWVDVEQDDVEAATRFYGAVLGWTFHDATPPGTPVATSSRRSTGRTRRNRRTGDTDEHPVDRPVVA